MAIQGVFSDIVQTANWIGAGRLAVLALAGFGAFHLAYPAKPAAPVVIRKPDCVMPFQTTSGSGLKLFIPCEVMPALNIPVERPLSMRGADQDVKAVKAKRYYDRILPEANVADAGVKQDRKGKRK